MAIEIDGVLKEWGDRLYYIRTRARPAPRSITGYRSANQPVATEGVSAASVRAILRRTVKRSPEVMVKITKGKVDPATGKPRPPCRDMRSIKMHFDYISRNGEVVLEDERGQAILGKQAVYDLRDDWQFSGGKAIPTDGGYRREAFNIILSMPAGTDRDGVRDAARAFACATFSDHQFVFASHEDEAHPHVHLCVKAVSRNLVRLNPRKQMLQRWREAFAEQLRQRGIEANATPRIPRGRIQKSQRQPVRHMDREFQSKRRTAPSRAFQGRQEAVRLAIGAGGEAEHPAEARVRQRREAIVQGYGHLARALASSSDAEDRDLALQIVEHVQQLPPAKTQLRIAVEAQQDRVGARDHLEDQSR